MHTTSTDALIRLALDEDIGTGDRTTLATIESDARAEAVVIAKEPLVLAGVPYFARVFELMQADLEVQATAPEGSLVDPGVTVVTLRGNARDLLIGERTALNILQRLSGIATLTRRFVDKQSGHLLPATPVEDAMRGDDDLAAILYTGGTTGAPKGVMLSHANLYSCSLGAILPDCRRDRVVALHSAPFFHVAGIGLILQVALRQGTQIVLPGFDPLAVLEGIAREQVGETFLVPTMLRAVLNHPRFNEFDLSSLHTMLYGASPIDNSLLRLALDKLPKAEFLQLYGMTELSPVVAFLPTWCHTDPAYADKLSAAGIPSHMAEIRIVDPLDAEVAHGEVGEITVRGPMVMQGYWNKPEQTEDALRGGWMHTGDAGYLDADGYVFLVDRIKDMVVTGGENVFSVEVEDALLRLPAIAQCAVIGVPDETWGERVHAVVVFKEGESADEQAIVAHCKEWIANYKCPRSFDFVDELPLSGAGKILKYKLKEPYWADKGRRIG